MGRKRNIRYRGVAPCRIDSLKAECGCVCACVLEDGDAVEDADAVVTGVSKDGFSVRTGMVLPENRLIDHVEVFFYTRAVPIPLAGKVTETVPSAHGGTEYRCTFGGHHGEDVVACNAVKYLNIHSPRRMRAKPA